MSNPSEFTPTKRLAALIDYSGHMEVNPTVSAKLYYKSGLNMYKQFLNYYKEGSWENAFCLYLKYECLFFHKIRTHPDYPKVPIQVKAINEANFRLIKPKAEHAKRELLKLYRRDYQSYKEEMKTLKGKRVERQSVQSSSSSFTQEFQSQVSFNTSRKLEQWRKSQKPNQEEELSAKRHSSSLSNTSPKQTSLEEEKFKKPSQSSGVSGRILNTAHKSVASSIGRWSVKEKTRGASLNEKKSISLDSLEVK